MKNVRRKSNSSLMIFILIAFFTLMCGCATYSQSIKGVKNQVLSRNYGGAINTLDKLGLAKSKKDSLLYYLEKGTILHLLGDYAQDTLEVDPRLE